MALKVDIETVEWIEQNPEFSITIEKVCTECALGYRDNLYTGVHLTDNKGIKEINREFRNIDKPTDVLSFPMLTASDGEIDYSDLDRDMESGMVILGDIIISVERAAEQAEEYGHSMIREIAFLACHGMLHLLGFDHETAEDEKLMTARQKIILNKLGFKKQEIT